MVAILEKAAGPENLKKAPIPTFEPTYKKLDRVVVWVLMIGGACMVLVCYSYRFVCAGSVFAERRDPATVLVTRCSQDHVL